jgi:tetratricopeptide (TPR) repeat protein
MSSELQSNIDEILRHLQPAKRFVDTNLGDIPFGIGDALRDIPLWIYAAMATFIALGVLFTAYEVILGIRNKAMLRLQGSNLGIAKEKRRVASEAAKFARKNNFSRAAELYLSVGEDRLAAETLEKGEMYGKAGQIYYSLGDLDRAIALYEMAGENNWLADALIKKGNYARAAEIFLKTGKNTLAAEAYEKAGISREAARLYEDAGHTVSAASHYEKAGNFKKAAALFDRAYIEGISSQEAQSPDRTKKLNDFSVKAGNYYFKSGDFAKAAEAFSRCKAYSQAGEAALSGGEKERAADYFTAGKEFDRAARIYSDMGNIRKASEVLAEQAIENGDDVKGAALYMDAGDFLKAAELFEKAGDFRSAGDAFLKEMEYGAAAEMFIRAGDTGRAADAYVKAGNPRMATDIFMKNGQPEKASALAEESGDFILAADLYASLGMRDKELHALQRVLPDDHMYFSAIIRLAESFKADGDMRLAAEKYLQGINGADADSSNLELYYNLAGVYESAKKFEDALTTYQKIQLVDFRYKDIDERIKHCATSMSRSATLQPGGEDPQNTSERAREAEKRYSILQEIGRGGMGVVYKAKDNHLNRVIALKLLTKGISNNPNVLKRFAAEARSAASLNHANIVTLFDFQQAGGKSFITMEYVEGVTLKKLMGMADRLPLTKSLKIIYQCCQGLDYAHKAGIIHRDIKPSNIMISKQNIVKIMDFGLAKIAGEETISEAGTISGTVLYMAPEQLLGDTLDRTVDIYALGLVLYELITGTHPFAVGDAAYHHVHSKPKPPKELRPDIPDNLNTIILTCLEKNPSRRIQSASQFALALREVPLNPS